MKNREQDKSTILYGILYNNEEYTEYITDNKKVTDTELIPDMLKDIENYVDFLYITNPQELEYKDFKKKSLSLLRKFKDNMFWLEDALSCFETFIELIKKGELSEEDLHYILYTTKFARGFRLFLIKMFSTKKKSRYSRKHRTFSDLDEIIVKLLENHAFTEEIIKNR